MNQSASSQRIQHPPLPESQAMASTLLERLHWRAVHQPARIAYQFLADQPLPVSQSELAVWTYKALYDRMQVIVNLLEHHALLQKPSHLAEEFENGFNQQPVLLVYPPGLELIAAFLSCLSVGAIAIPVPPPRRHESLARWQHIMTDAKVAGVLTTQVLLDDINSLMRSVSFQRNSTPFCLATDTVKTSHRAPDVVVRPAIAPEKIAFLQYTSGSTSQPKGVMVTHANLAHNLQQIQHAFGHSEDTRCVIWLPPYHDMGLIGGILQPLYGGYPVTLMSPTSFLRNPYRWLDAISYFRGTTSGGPNFAYDHCLQKISLEQRQTLDLSSWTVAFSGAEPVRAQTLDRFTGAFSGCGFRRSAFYPCYGLAEATLMVSGGLLHSALPTVVSVSQDAIAEGMIAQRPAGAPDAKQFVSCGQSAEQQIEIVDLQTQQPCASDQIGEIWVAGESVAAGYWGQVRATQEVFNNRLAGRSGNFLRTGDLGFVQSKELFITGRLKDLMVVRGQNYYPQDIELSVGQAHPSLQPAGAAFSLSSDDTGTDREQIVVVQEITRTAVRSLRKQTLQVSEIIAAICSAVSQQYGLQVWAIALLKPGHLPKTTSGKVQRQSCKSQFQAGTLDCVEQWSRSAAPQSATAIKQNDAQPDNSQNTQQNSQKTDELKDWLRAYAATSINSRLMDERRCISPGVILDFGNQGLLGMQVPQQYGGLGLNNLSTLRIIEQLGAIDPTLALFVGLNNVLGIRPILNHAQPALKEQLLPKLATGRELAAFALTEAGAGSHPFGIRAQATPQATGWTLKGEKIWSGSAAWAGVTNVFVQQTDETGAPVGISGFAVQKGTPGLKQGPEALTMGMRGMVQNTVLLDRAWVDESQRLGEAGQGMMVAQDAMMYGRLAIASASVGGMKRCAQIMLRYSESRTISTGRLLDNPVLLTRLSWLTNAIAAVESLVTLTATRLDAGLSIPEEIYAACKIAGPEFYWQAADHLVQCLGGRGYIEPNLAPQILRDSRILRIFEGPTESLAMYLGARVLKQPAGLRKFFEDLCLSAIGEQLFEAAEQILARYLSKSAPFSEVLQAQRQASFMVGNVATEAILLAALKSEKADLLAIAWGERQFEGAIARALQPNPNEAAITSAAAISEHIKRYQGSIGNVEKTLSGADEEMDELLKLEQHPRLPAVPQSEKAPQQTVHTQKTYSSSASPSTSRQKRTIENWIVQWLAKQLSVNVSTISPAKAFADYGMDSVMAVELAQDLGTFLKLSDPLEVTLAWNFPTIEALASHLTALNQPANPAMINNQSASDDKKEDFVKNNRSESSYAFGELSETEIADALAVELAAVRGR